MADSYIRLAGVSPKVQGLCWESDQVLHIGRQASADIVLHDTSVERLHAEIRFQGQRWIARPLTDNPHYLTQLNDLPVPLRGLAVKVGDVLQVGNLSLRVAALGSEASPTGADLPNLSQQPTRSLLAPRRKDDGAAVPIGPASAVVEGPAWSEQAPVLASPGER